MRIWYGPEMEGRHAGVPTLFIESPELVNSEDVLERIKSSPIKRLYFGAGKVDITCLAKNYFQPFLDKGYDIIAEVSYDNALIPALLIAGIQEVILRKDIKTLKTRTYLTFKTDNGEQAILYYPDTITALNEVKDGLYSTKDIMLWEE